MNNDTGIYSITSPSGKRYIGSAVSFKKRWSEHLRHLRTGRHHSKPLQDAFLKYGEESLIFAPLAFCLVTELLLIEQRYIDRMRPEYNVCKVAGSRLGTRQSPETIAKVVAANRGRKHSAEACAKRSAALRGRQGGPLTNDHKRKLSAALMGNARTLGKTLSPEHRAKLSAAGTGQLRPKSPEHRAKIAATLTGRRPTDEARAKMSASAKGRVFTDDHRAKLSAAVRAAKQRKRELALALAQASQ